MKCWKIILLYAPDAKIVFTANASQNTAQLNVTYSILHSRVFGYEMSEPQDTKMQHFHFTFWKEKWLENEYKYYLETLKTVKLTSMKITDVPGFLSAIKYSVSN